MKIIYCLMIFLWPVVSKGQNVKALSVGDHVPEIKINNLINYKTPTAKFSDFTADLLIIDFWSTWCVPCVKALPEFQQLQQQFKGKLQFVLAVNQEKDKISKFLLARKIDLPCVVEAKELSAYFPHNSVPHEVWIKNGKVIAITYAVSVTTENIQKILAEEPVDLVEKKWDMSFDNKLPLLFDGNGGNEKDLLYHSVFTRFLNGVSGGGGEITDDEGRLKISVLGASVARLYLTAAKYIDPSFRFYNQILIEAKNKDEIHPSENPQYSPSVQSFFYCYELIIPASEKVNAGTFMMEDINRFLGAVYHIRGDIEKIQTKCWVLKKVNEGVSIATKNGPSKIEGKDGYELFQNKPFSSFFYSISYINQNQPYPFVDKTGITDNIDIQLPDSVTDISSLQTYLKKYGFQLSLEESDLRMIVIKNIH